MWNFFIGYLLGILTTIVIVGAYIFIHSSKEDSNYE